MDVFSARLFLWRAVHHLGSHTRGFRHRTASRSPQAMKILIVGAGVAGLAIGWRLASAGVEVEILERGLAGRGAPWASAGRISGGGGSRAGKKARPPHFPAAPGRTSPTS